MYCLRENQVSYSGVKHSLIRVLAVICIRHILLQLIDDGLIEDLRLAEPVLVHDQTLIMLFLQLKVEENNWEKELNGVLCEKEGQSAGPKHVQIVEVETGLDQFYS